jgi:hypothetical protein
MLDSWVQHQHQHQQRNSSTAPEQVLMRFQTEDLLGLTTNQAMEHLQDKLIDDEFEDDGDEEDGLAGEDALMEERQCCQCVRKMPGCSCMCTPLRACWADDRTAVDVRQPLCIRKGFKLNA